MNANKGAKDLLNQEAVSNDSGPDGYSKVDQVVIDIDYHIIKHFSEHLYSSPNKAIEELVANGYDAGASWVKVYLPNFYSKSILVWDNGGSMDDVGIKGLWRLADSPKSKGDRTVAVGTTSRDIIGKFGIGKIASYTVGDEIAHLCKSMHGFYLVSVDYEQLLNSTGELKSLDIDEPKASSEVKKDGLFQCPIYKLTEDEAKGFLKTVFSSLPRTFEEDFRAPTWTVAIISKLKKEVTTGRLKWVLANGMPIQPQFSVFVNEQTLESTIYKKELSVEFNLGEKKVGDILKARWRDAGNDKAVEGELVFGAERGLDVKQPDREIPYVVFPNLGKVWGVFRLYKRSLLDYKNGDEGRSFGFFLMVRGRLVNSDDAQLLLHDPSFGTFYSAQWIIHADQVDEQLLADRERFQSDTKMSLELKLLQKAVYTALESEKRDLVPEDTILSLRKILPVASPELFTGPLMALWMHQGGIESLGFDYRNPQISGQPLGRNELLSAFDVQSGFLVNSEHPYYRNVSKSVGTGKKALQLMREIEAIAVAESLFEGYLIELGIGERERNDIRKWRDHMFRSLATRDIHNEAQIIQRLEESSMKRGAPFEQAIVDVLNSMGFVAERDGSRGEKDGFVVANCGTDTYRFIFEAKAQEVEGKALPNAKACVSAAAAHRRAAKADFAVIIARDFAGFDKERGSSEAAIIRECKEQKDNAVIIMELDAFVQLYQIVKQKGLPLNVIRPILTKLETPDEKLASIRALQTAPDFDYFLLLTRIWQLQQQQGEGESIPIKQIWQQHYRTEVEKFEDFKVCVETLQWLAPQLIKLDDSDIALTQSPENISTAIKASFLEK